MDSRRWPVKPLPYNLSSTTVSSLQTTPDQLQAPAVFVVFHPTGVVLAKLSRTASSLPGIAEQVGGKIWREEGRGRCVAGQGVEIASSGGKEGSRGRGVRGGVNYEGYGEQEESV